MPTMLERLFLENATQEDKVLAQYFLAFAKNEFAINDILCWSSIMTFKGQKTWVVPTLTGNNDHQKAMAIYTAFLSTTSQTEVNVGSGSRKAVETAVFPQMSNERGYGRSKAILVTSGSLRSCFDGALRELNTSISDNWSRFIGTKEYAQYQILRQHNSTNTSSQSDWQALKARKQWLNQQKQ